VGVTDRLWALIMMLIVSSVIGLFYYLRLVAVMYARPESRPGASAPHVSYSGGVVLATLASLLLWLGLYPQPLLRVIESVFPS
jgi:NADH-quinone oxidoreductase subunit N